MADTGWIEFTAAASGGGNTWSNPTFALTDAASGAAISSPDESEQTATLSLTDSSAALASLSGTIDGIEIEVVASGNDSSSDYLIDYVLQLIIGGSATGDNKAISTQWTDASILTRTYGGPTDKWGLTPTDAQLKASNAGFYYIAQNQGNSGTAQMRIYRVRWKIYYTPSGGGSDVNASGAGIFSGLIGEGAVEANNVSGVGAGIFSGLVGVGVVNMDIEAAGAGIFSGLVGTGDVAADPAHASGEGVFSGLVGNGLARMDIEASGAGIFPGLVGVGISAPDDVASGAGIFSGLVGAGVSVADIVAAGAGIFGGLTGNGHAGGPGNEAFGAGIFGGLIGAGAVSEGSAGPADGRSLVEYLAGADTTGAPQRDPEASVNGFRSDVPLSIIDWDMPDAMIGVEVQAVSGQNGIGVGSISAPTSGSLSWTPPGGTPGIAITVTNGSIVVLPGNNTAQWIKVKRTSAVPLSGTKSLYCLDIYNNLFPDVASDDAIAGEVVTRSVFLRNEAAGLILNVKAWVAESDGTISLAYETPTAGELSGAGLSYSSPTTSDTAIERSGIAADGLLGLQVKRTVAADATPSPRTRWAINISYSDGTTTYTKQIRGLYRIARNDYIGDGIWIGVGGDDPDFDAAPDAIWTSTPNTTSLGLASDETYRVAFRTRNPWGLWGIPTTIQEFVIDGSGDSVLSPPSAPTSIIVSQTSADKPRVTASYDADADGLLRAELWAIWLEVDGTDPDGSATPDGYAAIQHNGALVDLAWESTGSALGDGTPVSALVRTRRLDNAGGTAFAPDVIQLDDTDPGTLKVTGEISDWPTSGYGRTYTGIGSRKRILEVWSYTSIVDAAGFTTVTVDARGLMGTTAVGTSSGVYVEPVTVSDSINTAVSEWDIVSVPPGRPHGSMLFGLQAAQFQTPVDGPDGTTPVVIDVTENVHMVLGEGWSSLYVDTTLVWRTVYHSINGEANAVYIPSEWDIVNAAVSGAAVDAGVFDVVDSDTVYVVVNGTRRILIDLAAMEITVASIVEDADMPRRAEQAGSLAQFGATVLLVWDPSIEDYRPWAQLTSGGVLNLAPAVDNTLTQLEVEAIWQV